MATIDRRKFLAMGGLGMGASALGLSGCTRSSSRTATAGGGGGGGEDPVEIVWWDHFAPLAQLEEATFTTFAATSGGLPVRHTVYNPNDMGPALQLAQTSNQMPDVFTNLFGVPDTTLHQNGWVSPLKLSESALPSNSGGLVSGLHTFDGDVYTVPLFTARQHSTLSWFNTDLVERAGGDPERGAATWDEFRALAKAISKGGGASGWVEGLTFTDRLSAHVIDLAQGAGQQLSSVKQDSTPNGMADPASGDYAFDSEQFVAALDFLRSLVTDGSMLPASTSLDAMGARARWAAGSAGLFFDGPWNIGVLSGQFADFTDAVGVSQMPTPNGTAQISKGPAAGVFWLSSTSGAAEPVSQLVEQLLSRDYALALAERMDQPPADLDVVAGADVHPTYATAVDIFQRSITIAPSAVGKNPGVALALAQMQDVRPNLGEITQGYLGGDVPDVRAALADYTGKLSAERDRAMQAVSDSGTPVSQDDWVFTDYVPGQDYDAENYGA